MPLIIAHLPRLSTLSSKLVKLMLLVSTRAESQQSIDGPCHHLKFVFRVAPPSLNSFPLALIACRTAALCGVQTPSAHRHQHSFRAYALKPTCWYNHRAIERYGTPLTLATNCFTSTFVAVADLTSMSTQNRLSIRRTMIVDDKATVWKAVGRC